MPFEAHSGPKIAKYLHNTPYTKYGSDKVMEVTMGPVHGICKILQSRKSLNSIKYYASEEVVEMTWTNQLDDIFSSIRAMLNGSEGEYDFYSTTDAKRSSLVIMMTFIQSLKQTGMSDIKGRLWYGVMKVYTSLLILIFGIYHSLTSEVHISAAIVPHPLVGFPLILMQVCCPKAQLL